MHTQFAGQIALVTGASKGIGRALALQLAAAGAHIIAVARTKRRLESLDDEIKAIGGTATLVPLDVQDGEMIDRLGYEIATRFGKLDILVGCAATLGDLMPVTHISPEKWQKTLSINLTANWRLLRSMDALLRAAPQGKVLFLSDASASPAEPYWGAYAISKAALEQLAALYQQEVATTAIKVVCLKLAPVATGLRNAAMPGEDTSTLLTTDQAAAQCMTALSALTVSETV